MLDNKARAIHFLECATRYQAADCLSLMTADATWWIIGEPGRLRVAGTKDRAQIERLLHGLAKFIPLPMELSILGVTAEGDRVAVEAQCVGTWRNGTTYRNHYHFLFEFHGALIRSVREYMDTLQLFETLQRDRLAADLTEKP